MHFVYILRSNKDKEMYIGITKDLVSRVREHNQSQVRSTKHRKPMKLIGFRLCKDVYEARVWEKKYKHSHGHLERDFKNGKINSV